MGGGLDFVCYLEHQIHFTQLILTLFQIVHKLIDLCFFIHAGSSTWCFTNNRAWPPNNGAWDQDQTHKQDLLAEGLMADRIAKETIDHCTSQDPPDYC